MNSKGIRLECALSKKVHLSGVPILIDAYFLRLKGLGQVDLCVLHSEELVLFECKSSGFISSRQIKRLKYSAFFLSTFFKVRVDLKVFFGRDEEYFDIECI